MRLPFDAHQFFGVFARYNTAVWPAQIALVVAALAAVALALRPRAGSDRTVGVILGGLWLWMGGVYDLVFFRPINRASGSTWSAVGASAAVQLGVWEDLGLVVAGGLTLVLTLVPVSGAARSPSPATGRASTRV